MATLKKFFRYFLMFLFIFIFVTIFTQLELKKKKQIEEPRYSIKTTSPKIEVEECLSEGTKGYIKGIIINDTNKHIKDRYLKFNFYNKDNTYLASKYQEIKYFNVDEKISFNIEFNYKNVNFIEIELVDKITGNIKE